MIQYGLSNSRRDAHIRKLLQEEFTYKSSLTLLTEIERRGRRAFLI
jgi:hypothetical protein